MIDRADRDRLVEACAGAFRERDALGRVRAHPAWHDLDASGRVDSYQLARQLRALEAASDPEGLSTTSRAILARVTASRGSSE
jgi:hypothetical protein